MHRTLNPGNKRVRIPGGARGSDGNATVKPTANGARVRRVYSSGEVGFFFILTAEGDSYLVPLAITKGASSLTLDCKYAAFKVA
jgi:hypothetical protein